MIKVVTAAEMVRTETGYDEKAFMEEAGHQIALQVEKFSRVRKVALLIGKGNNGGDAYVAGALLRDWGYEVRAIPLFPKKECSKLNSHFSFPGTFDLDFSNDDLIIDGILGTGFQGKVDGIMAVAIEKANASGKPILSIDIPSGVNGTTGEVGGSAIFATETVTLGLPKTGLFLRSGWNCTGKLTIADFGLPAEAIERAQAQFYIPKLKELTLPKMTRNQHKYQRGFVLGFGGSAALKGAIKLSGNAALHSGAGVVKIFSLEEIGATADELICQIFDPKAWNEAFAKAQALFIGPGLGRSENARQWLADHLPTLDKPCVIDADGLFFLKELPTWPKNAILTPHRGEMIRLIGEPKDEESFIQQIADLATAKQTIIILKGAPTFILAPNQLPLVIPRGDPGMATAGSGDVLTGILAALLAQGKEPLDAAILGVALHALAGEAASKEKTSYSYTATDLIAFLPKAFELFR